MAPKPPTGGSGYSSASAVISPSARIFPTQSSTSSTVNPATDNAERTVPMSGSNPCGSPPTPTT